MNDIILLDSAFTYQNRGTQTGQGLELEATWDAFINWRLSGSYSRQRSIDETTDQDAGRAPRDRVYLRSDWRFLPAWSLDTQVNWVADRKRQPGDTRSPIDDYTVVDLALHYRDKLDIWGLTLSVNNLFDADAREPSEYGTPFVSIPNDIPLAGRSYLLQVRYRSR